MFEDFSTRKYLLCCKQESASSAQGLVGIIQMNRLTEPFMI